MSAIGALVLVALVAVGVLYVARSYKKMTAGGTANHFGLEPGETAKLMWVGELETEISTAERVGTAALGLVAGALLGGVGIATVRALGVTAIVTSRGRLVFVCERQDGTVGRIIFGAPGEGSVRHVGPGSKRIQGGPSAIFDVSASDGVPLRILLHESAVTELAPWSGLS